MAQPELNTADAGKPAKAADSLTQKTAWSSLASLFNILGRLAASVVIGRALGLEGTGQIAYYIWMTEVVIIMVGFGFRSSVPRYLAHLSNDENESRLRAFAEWLFLRFVLLLGVGCAAIAYWSWRAAENDIERGLMPLIVMLFGVRYLESFYMAFLNGIQAYPKMAGLNLISALAMLAGVTVGALGWGNEGALYGYLASSLLPALYSLQLLRWRMRMPLDDPLLARRFMWNCFYGWLAGILDLLTWQRIEIFFIKRYWGLDQVGLFTVGITLATIAREFPLLLSRSFMPHFAQLAGEGNRAKIQTAFDSGTRIIAFVLFPVCFGGAAIMPVLLPLIYGAKFAPAVPSAILLILLSSLSFSIASTALVYAEDKVWFIVACGSVGAVMSIGLHLLITPHYGVLGAVVVRAIVQLTMIVGGYCYVILLLKVKFPASAVFRSFLAAVFCALAAALFLHWGGVAPLAASSATIRLLWLMPSVLIGAVCYAAASKWLRVLTESDIDRCKLLMNDLPATAVNRLMQLLKLLLVRT